MNTKEQINYLYEKARQKEHMKIVHILTAGASPCEGCGSNSIVSRKENGKIVHVDIYDYNFKTIPCPGE